MLHGVIFKEFDHVRTWLTIGHYQLSCLRKLAAKTNYFMDMSLFFTKNYESFLFSFQAEIQTTPSDHRKSFLVALLIKEINCSRLPGCIRH